LLLSGSQMGRLRGRQGHLQGVLRHLQGKMGRLREVKILKKIDDAASTGRVGRLQDQLRRGTCVIKYRTEGIEAPSNPGQCTSG